MYEYLISVEEGLSTKTLFNSCVSLPSTSLVGQISMVRVVKEHVCSTECRIGAMNTNIDVCASFRIQINKSIHKVCKSDFSCTQNCNDFVFKLVTQLYTNKYLRRRVTITSPIFPWIPHLTLLVAKWVDAMLSESATYTSKYPIYTFISKMRHNIPNYIQWFPKSAWQCMAWIYGLNPSVRCTLKRRCV